jgi:hypothetical protein
MLDLPPEPRPGVVIWSGDVEVLDTPCAGDDREDAAGEDPGRAATRRVRLLGHEA